MTNFDKSNQFTRNDRHDDWDDVHNQMIEVQQKNAVQKKSLAVSNPGDTDEKEADEVARKVAGGESATVHGTGGTINRKGQGDAETTPEFQSKLENSKGKGQSLPENLQNELGGKMRADFSAVKIHTGGEAHGMNENVNAKAFTHGQDVYFREGEYNAQSSAGKELLAHELVHTVQQARGSNMIQRTAMARKSGEIITVTSHIYFYGAEASDTFAKDAGLAIQQGWNEPKGEVKIGDKIYHVEFQIFPHYEPDLQKIIQLSESKGSDPEFNFVRVEKQYKANVQKGGHNVSQWNRGGNSAIFQTESFDPTEFAHEYGHGLGLEHYTSPKKIPFVYSEEKQEFIEYVPKDYPDKLRNRGTNPASDFRGEVPDIMIPEGGHMVIVDPQYQRDKNATATDASDHMGSKRVNISSESAFMDTKFRKVTQNTINRLNLATLLATDESAPLGVMQQVFIGWDRSDKTHFASVGANLPGDYRSDMGTTTSDASSYKKTKLLRDESGIVDAEIIKVYKVTGENDMQKIQSDNYDPMSPELPYSTTAISLYETINNSAKGKGKYLKGKKRLEFIDQHEDIVMGHPEKLNLKKPDQMKWMKGQAKPE